MQEGRPPLRLNFTARTPSPYPQAPFLKLGYGIGVFSWLIFTLFSIAVNLLPDFQIALNHSILKIKSIVIPLDKMSRSGEKHAQD